MLNSELDDELRYDKYNQSKNNSDNSRKWFSNKNMRSGFSDDNIKILRDRNGEFGPQIVKKYQKDLDTIEQQIITLYAKGMKNLLADTKSDLYYKFN